jgi:hypothetical protein
MINEMKQTIHIGNKIRDKLKEDGRTVVWLAEKLDCDTSNIYRIFQKESMGSGQLFKISVIMGYNFLRIIRHILQVAVYPHPNLKNKHKIIVKFAAYL